MKIKTLLSQAVLTTLLMPNMIAAVVYTDNFSTSTIKAGTYAGVADDGKWVRTGGFTSIENAVPDDGLNVGNELRVGYAALTDMTVPVAFTLWDDTMNYTISASFRAFDASPSTSSMNFIVARRNGSDVLGFISKNIATTVNQSWVTLTHTVTASEVTSLGIDGMRMVIRVQNNAANATAGDLVYMDNLQITATAVPEPAQAGLLAAGLFFFLARRRRA